VGHGRFVKVKSFASFGEVALVGLAGSFMEMHLQSLLRGVYVVEVMQPGKLEN
jgi:hypothetical protein